LIELAKEHSEAAFEEQVFNDSFEGMVIYVNKVDREKNQINGILISDKRDAEFPTVIVAEGAKIFSDAEKDMLLFKLFNGSLHRLDRKSMAYQYAVFKTYEMNIPLVGSVEEEKVKKKDMKISELIKLSRQRKNEGTTSSVRIDVEIHKRLSFPFACFVFGLLGVSLGISWRRGGKSYGFVLSILIVFLYYIFLSMGENLAKSGYIYAFMGIWMPNILLGSIGIYLFRKTAREDTIPVLQWFRRSFLQTGVVKTKEWIMRKTGKF
jgi:lipopolysaccharide export system permease protein